MNAWQPATIEEAVLKAAQDEEVRLNQINTYRLTYTHDKGTWSRTVQGSVAWFEAMQGFIGIYIDGFGVLTYIGPPV